MSCCDETRPCATDGAGARPRRRRRPAQSALRRRVGEFDAFARDLIAAVERTSRGCRRHARARLGRRGRPDRLDRSSTSGRTSPRSSPPTRELTAGEAYLAHRLRLDRPAPPRRPASATARGRASPRRAGSASRSTRAPIPCFPRARACRRPARAARQAQTFEVAEDTQLRSDWNRLTATWVPIARPPGGPLGPLPRRSRLPRRRPRPVRSRGRAQQRAAAARRLGILVDAELWVALLAASYSASSGKTEGPAARAGDRSSRAVGRARNDARRVRPRARVSCSTPRPRRTPPTGSRRPPGQARRLTGCSGRPSRRPRRPRLDLQATTSASTRARSCSTRRSRASPRARRSRSSPGPPTHCDVLHACRRTARSPGRRLPGDHRRRASKRRVRRLRRQSGDASRADSALAVYVVDRRVVARHYEFPDERRRARRRASFGSTRRRRSTPDRIAVQTTVDGKPSGRCSRARRRARRRPAAG